MNAKYVFYEVVKVHTERPKLKKIDALSGAILGMAQDDNGEWSYSVQIFDNGISYSLKESELLKTGIQMSREDFYD